MAEMERKPKRTRAASTVRTGSRKASGRLAPAPSAEEPSRETGEEERPVSVPPSSDTVERAPDPDLHARIRERAFLIFESRGRQHGYALDHWLEAERQVAGFGSGFPDKPMTQAE